MTARSKPSRGRPSAGRPRSSPLAAGWDPRPAPAFLNWKQTRPRPLPWGRRGKWRRPLGVLAGHAKVSSERVGRLPLASSSSAPSLRTWSPANSVDASQRRIRPPSGASPPARPLRPPEVTTPARPCLCPVRPRGGAGRWRRREPWNGASWSSAALSAKGRGTFGSSPFAALVRQHPSGARSEPSPRASPMDSSIFNPPRYPSEPICLLAQESERP